MFQRFTNGSETGSADIVNSRLLVIERQQISIQQIVRVNELKQTVAAPDNIDVATLANPFKENLENAEASLAQDSAGPDDDQRQPRSVADFADHLLAREFGAAINLRWAQRSGLGDRALF